MKTSARSQLELNFNSSAEVRITNLPGGAVKLEPGRVLVEGTVRDAMRVLGKRWPGVIYALIESGDIKAYKANPNGRNAHFTVDMTSVYALKERQRAAASDN